MRRALAAGLAAALLTACAPGSNGIGPVGRIEVDLDTPELRALKKDAGVEPCVSPTAAPAADGLPEVALECLGGGPAVDVSRLRGPMVVNFFASWCPPCVDELPILADFHRRHGDQVAVLGIDWSDTQALAALQMIRTSGATFPLVADPNTDLAEEGLRVPKLPMLVLLDAEGDIAFAQPMAVESRAELEGLVAEHLGVEL